MVIGAFVLVSVMRLRAWENSPDFVNLLMNDREMIAKKIVIFDFL